MQHFPREYIYLVPLYGGIKALENSMAGLEGDSDLSTAITAANTELDETQAVCDAINTNVDSAISELGEAATAVDAKIDTAADAITTAAGRINTAVALANLEFDKAEQEADAAEAEADDGAIATALTNINGNIENGDYITTSDIAGYGMKQDDDILHNYTVAKATMDCTFDNSQTDKYETRLVTKDGTNYIAAFIACTYHCG